MPREEASDHECVTTWMQQPILCSLSSTPLLCLSSCLSQHALQYSRQLLSMHISSSWWLTSQCSRHSKAHGRARAATCCSQSAYTAQHSMVQLAQHGATSTAQHSMSNTAQRSTTSTAQHSATRTAQHSMQKKAQHSAAIAQHSIAQHSAAQHPHLWSIRSVTSTSAGSGNMTADCRNLSTCC